MTGVIALMAFVGLAVVTVQRLWIALSVVVAVLVFIPQVASGVIGIPVVSGMNVGSVLIVVIAAVQLVVRGRVYLGDVLASMPASLAFIALAGTTELTSVATTTTTQQQFLIDAILPGALVFTLLRRALADDAGSGKWFVRAFLVIVSAECVLALLVWWGAIPQPFAAQYAEYYYWFGPDFDRALGSADSPLNLGVTVLIAVCLLRGIRQTWLVTSGAALFLATIFATESRTALFLATIALLGQMVARRVPIVPFAGTLIATAGTTVAVLLAVPELGEGLTAKLADDNGSGNARQIGLAEGLPALLQYPFVGGGPSSAVTTAIRSGLGTSFENPFIMLGLNWGLIATLCYFGLQIGSVLASPSAKRAVRGARLTGALTIAAVLSFSSVAFVSGLGTLVWMAVAMAAPPLHVLRAGHTTANAVRPTSVTTTAALR